MTSTLWTTGYTQAELDRAQERFDLVFPLDLIALLRDRRLRNGHDLNDEAVIRERLAWPFEGLLFDVEHNVLWWQEWGERPDNPEGRAEVLRGAVAKAPKLIPLYRHRYLPQEPRESGNPVLSVYQSDVIYYGADLEDYFEREFGDGDKGPVPNPVKHIPFWSDLVLGHGRQ